MAGLRALLSLVMLAGFYVVAFVQLAATLAFTYWLSLMWPGPLGLLLTLPLYIVSIGSVAGAFWVALRSRLEPMGGIVVGTALARPLWTMVGELAATAGTRVPDEIRIVTGVEASVSERVRLLGLLPGRRYLFVGLPLLICLPPNQIRAIIAHELGHYSRAHTRMAPVAYRGRRAIAGTVGRIHKINPVGWVFRAYHRLYLLVDRSVSRMQELQADADAVRAAGKTAAMAALVEAKALSAAFTHFIDTHIVPRADLGYLPDNLYEGFAGYLQAHRAQLADLRVKAMEDKGRLWDTHPPLSERIYMMERMPEPPEPAVGPATLVNDADELGRVLTPHVVPHVNCEVLPWDEFVSATATAQVAKTARRVRHRELHLATDAEIVMVLANAALESGVAHWRSSWTGPPELVGEDGEPLPLPELARLVRRSKADSRLRELGIRLDAETIEPAKPKGLRILGGVGNVKTEARRFAAEADLLILNTGLVLLPTTRDSDEGNIRLRALINRMSLEQITREHRYVPLESITRATVTRKIPFRISLALHDGETVTLRESWTGDRLTEDSSSVLLKLLSRYEENLEE